MLSNLAKRDIETLVHPYTNLKTHRENGPLVRTRGEGVYVYDEAGKEYIEGLAGLWCTALGYYERGTGRCRQRRCAAALYHQFGGRSHDTGDRPGRAADRHGAGADVEGVLRRLRLGGERHRGEDGLVLQQRDRPPAEEEDHLAHPRLSRHHGRVGQPDRPARQSPRLRPADRQHPAHVLPALTIASASRARARRTSPPARRQAGEADPAEGPETVAAFIGEPVMGAGGVIVPPATYLEKIQAVCRNTTSWSSPTR